MKRKHIILILCSICIFGIIASIVASSHPDGLEWVAEKLDFISVGENKEVFKSPFPDYTIPYIKNPYLTGGIAAIIGTLIVFVVTFLISKLIQTIKKSKTSDQ